MSDERITDETTTEEILNSATKEQVERANRAVTACLNTEGEPLWQSAQGYACALTAIMQTDAAMRALEPSPIKDREVVEALKWYAEQVSGCRKIGSIGDPFRRALDADGGERARAALAAMSTLVEQEQN